MTDQQRKEFEEDVRIATSITNIADGPVDRCLWFLARERSSKEVIELVEAAKEMDGRIELLEAALRLIAEPERQSNYTPQQLARHTLRIEALTPFTKGG